MSSRPKPPAKYAILLKTDGTSHLIAMTAKPSLKEWQNLVNGNIESVPFKPTDIKPPDVKRNRWVIICNEEGMLLNLAKNPFLPEYHGNLIVCQMTPSNFSGFVASEIQSLPSKFRPECPLSE